MVEQQAVSRTRLRLAPCAIAHAISPMARFEVLQMESCMPSPARGAWHSLSRDHLSRTSPWGEVGTLEK